jgi:S1-C subfamily serine protease
LIYPYPDPHSAGLKLDPRAMAKIERVEPGSTADLAGFKAGDEIVSMDGQPLLSIADLQWVLHNSPETANLLASVRRNGQIIPLTLPLDSGWRRGDISWRTTTWPLREMAFGGMKLENLTIEERRHAGIPPDRMALKIVYLFEYGDRIAAKRAGLRKGDIIVAVDGKSLLLTESDLLSDILKRKQRGESISVTLLRAGVPETVSYALP